MQAIATPAGANCAAATCDATDHDVCCTPSANFYINDAGTAVAHTTCGNQVTAAATRLTGESTTAAGTCAACAADTYAGTDGADCLANTVCGNLAAGGSRDVGERRSSRGGETNTKRVFINVGKMDGFENKGQLLGFLCNQSGVDGGSLGKIDLFDSFAFVGVDDGVGEKMISSMNGKNIENRDIRVEFSQDKPQGERGGGDRGDRGSRGGGERRSGGGERRRDSGSSESRGGGDRNFKERRRRS